MTTKKVSLSADEVALIFSLLNKPELGRQILLLTYGELSQSIIEHKLITASHSLLAHSYVAFKNENKIILQKKLKEIFAPIIEFDNVIQLTSNDDEELVIINIYLSPQHKFTAHHIADGVVYHYAYGAIEDIPDFIAQKVNLPDCPSVADEDLVRTQDCSIKMADFVNIVDVPLQEKISILTNNGISNPLAEELAKDMMGMLRRGSIVRVDVGSNDTKNHDFDKAGAGVLYFVGDNSGWVLALNETNDESVGKLVAGTPENLKEQLNLLILY